MAIYSTHTVSRSVIPPAASQPDPGLSIEIDSKWFPAVGDAPAHEAIKGLRLSARRGEFVAVVGTSGCGKNSTLNITAGLDRDCKGRIRLPTAAGRSNPVLGYMFQNPRLL